MRELVFLLVCGVRGRDSESVSCGYPVLATLLQVCGVRWRDSESEALRMESENNA